MSRGGDNKAYIYYYARRGWHEQLVSFCDEIISRKGKDPVTVFWKAYGLGMTHGLGRVQGELEVFQNRRDLQLPLTTALLYFAQHHRGGSYDYEYIRSLEAELSVAEEMTKDAGLVMTARFCLFVGDYQRASTLSQKLLQQCNGAPSTPFEIEAQTIDGWSAFAEASQQLKESCVSGSDNDEVSTTTYRKLQAVDDLVNGRGEQFDVDTLMLHANVKSILSFNSTPNHHKNEIVSIFNQVVAMQPQFVPALAEKSILLASIGEWDHALEFAQRALDIDKDYYDALVVIAVHAFTQESDPRDAARKLDDVLHAYLSKEASSYILAIEASSLFSSICARQPKALETCIGFLRHAQKLEYLSDPAQASVFCALGNIYLMQGVGGYDGAMTCYKEASKIDPQSVKALEGMISCQLSEGLYDDAEAQIELLNVMHSTDEQSAEFHYLKSLLAKHRAKSANNATSGTDGHLFHLDECRRIVAGNARPSSLHDIGQSPFNYIVAANPDFLLRIAVDYMEYSDGDGFLSFTLFNTSKGVYVDGDTRDTTLNNTASMSEGVPISAVRQPKTMTLGATHHASSVTSSFHSSLSTPAGNQKNTDIGSGMSEIEISRTVSRGLEILNKLLTSCPGMTCLYIEISRCLGVHRMFSDAVRILNQCLVLQPHSAAAMVALALIEIRQQRPLSAQSILEQALSCDFSIRSVTIFRLAQAIVNAQLGKLDEALTALDALLALPDIRSNNPVDAAGLSNGGIGSAEVSSQGFAKNTGDYTDNFRLTNDDRVAAFLVHASLLSRLRRQKEANKILSEAKVLFAGMPQETQILITQSQMSIERKDYDSAIRRLDKIETSNSSYSKAQMLKADILLKGNRDREGYTRCFTNLIDKDPSAKNYALLADAYLRILSPEAAIDALEIAYSKDPANCRLRVRIGRTLTATHEYRRAVKFYESAIDEAHRGDNGGAELVGLSVDLAKLYVKLDRTTDAAKVLQAALCNEADARDITDLQHDVTILLLLSDVQLHNVMDLSSPSSVENMIGGCEHNERTYTSEEKERISSALQSLETAHRIQKNVVEKSRTSLPGVAKANSRMILGMEKAVLSNICAKEATLTFFLGSGEKNEDTLALLSESLVYDPENVRAMVSIANVHMKNGDAFKCRSQCEKSLQASSLVDEEAWIRILLSEALYYLSTQEHVDDLKRFETSGGGVHQINDTEDMIEDFKGPDISEIEEKQDDRRQELSTNNADREHTLAGVLVPLEDFLMKYPNHYRALERMISLSRRLGLLKRVPRLLDVARSSDGRSETHPGFRYCKGLYSRYTNDVGAAIVEFNAARGDSDWGCSSLRAMIDLYLNPDQDYNNLAWDERESGPIDEISANNLSAADSLLQELKGKTKSGQHVKVLENYCLLATRNKGNVQQVLESFIEILEGDQDHLPAILGLATAYMIEKEHHKAKNLLLKRIAKLAPHKHDGEDFSKAHFLIARMHIDKGRFDAAQDSIKKVLAQNRSSAGAWELMGLVMEKAQDYAKAAECYEKAWSLTFESSAPVGFKLAYCYMKASLFIHSLDICEKVLETFPQYPRIREEILETCVSRLAEE